jgi:transglutaminase-like putative cysteine protease
MFFHTEPSLTLCFHELSTHHDCGGTMQRRSYLGIFCVLAVPLAGHTGEKPAQLVEEIWEAAYLEEVKAGASHTTVQIIEVEGVKRFRTRTELDLTFRRYNTSVRLRLEQGTEETPDGKVVAVSMKQGQEKGPQLVLVGNLEGDRMHVRVDNGRIERRLPWSDQAVGLYQREHLFQDRKPRGVEQFSFLRYEPTVNRLIRVQVAVGQAEEVALPSGKKTLLRVDMTPEKIEVPGQRVLLPPEVWWLDDTFVPVRRQIELEGLGAVILVRGTRAAATAAPAVPARLTDIGVNTLVPLNRTIARPYQTRAAVYRITVRGDPEPGSALVSDAHQEIQNIRGNTFDLHVHPVQVSRPSPPTPLPRGARGQESSPLPPGARGQESSPLAPGGRGVGGEGESASPGPEYLGSSHYITSADERIKTLARRAVGEATDSWKKARRIETWVKHNMKPDNGAAFAPAAQVARDLRGDCRMFALLTTALCRAEGIPARTALGLLYVERGSRPQMGFHMWTEVWIDGRWLGLDGTLGLGGVSAGHVKIADHSWHNTQSLTPLLPVSRVLGKLAIEVVSTE